MTQMGNPGSEHPSGGLSDLRQRAKAVCTPLIPHRPGNLALATRSVAAMKARRESLENFPATHTQPRTGIHATSAAPGAACGEQRSAGTAVLVVRASCAGAAKGLQLR